MTCWRRLRDWQLAGIWDLTHFVLLNWLSRNGQSDWSHAVVDRQLAHGSGFGDRVSLRAYVAL